MVLLNQNPWLHYSFDAKNEVYKSSCPAVYGSPGNIYGAVNWRISFGFSNSFRGNAAL